LFQCFNVRVDRGCSNDAFSAAPTKCDKLARFLLSTGITYTKLLP
jgi:hypothetical protein